MRAAVVVSLMGSFLGCKGDAPPAARGRDAAPVPRPIDAAPPDATKLDLVVDGPVAGTLSGATFAPTKAFLWVSPRGARLELYQRATGGPCTPQLAPRDGDLYVSIQFPAAHARAGGVVTDATREVLISWKRPSYDAVDRTLALALDEVGPARVRGRLRLIAPDGTEVTGALDATLCTSPQRDLPPGDLHGLSWSDPPTDPAELPRAPLAAIHVGDRIVPAAVELVDASRSDSTQHELHFFRDAPATPCEPSFGGRVGFELSLGTAPLAGGFALRQHVELVHPSGQPYGAVSWSEPGDVRAMEGKGDVALILDELGDTGARGRIYARFTDPARSLLVGAFTARRCR